MVMAGATVPSFAFAQDVPPAVVPLVTPPAPQAAAPPAPVRPPGALGAIDRTKTYYLFFDQVIDVASMRAMRREMANLAEGGVKHIVLVLNSPGGAVEPMLITYSFIRALPVRIDTHAQGFVQSAATVLFLAGEGRTADHAARFLFHPSQLPLNGSVTEQQLRDRATQMDAVSDVIGGIYRERAAFPDGVTRQFEQSEVIVTADQAQQYGIVQSVDDLRIPGDGSAKITFLG